MKIGDAVTVPLNVDGDTLLVAGVVVDVAETIGLATVLVEHEGQTRRVGLPVEARGADPAPSLPEEEPEQNEDDEEEE